MTVKLYNHKRTNKIWVAVTKRGKALAYGATKEIAMEQGENYIGYYGTIQTTITYWDDNIEEDELYSALQNETFSSS